MRRALPYIAALLAYLMTPGSAEVTENVIHFVANGHSAHAVADDEHQPSDVEHGCSGPFHVCACHQSTGFALTRIAGLSPIVTSPVQPFASPRPLVAQGFVGRIFRPPIA